MYFLWCDSVGFMFHLAHSLHVPAAQLLGHLKVKSVHSPSTGAVYERNGQNKKRDI